MTNFKQQIYETLSQEDKALFDAQVNEMGVFDALRETFKGKHRLLNIFGFVLSFIVFGVVVWFGYQFFNAGELVQKLNWLAGFLTGVVAIAALKIWFWMEMNRVALIRDIKRLELQLSLLLKHKE